MTQNEYDNLKKGDTVYLLRCDYEDEIPCITECTIVGNLESETEKVIKVVDKEEYTFGGRYSMFLSRKEAEKEAISALNRRIETNKLEVERFRKIVKMQEDFLLKFQQSCIELKK